jgi:hypothetical protein
MANVSEYFVISKADDVTQDFSAMPNTYEACIFTIDTEVMNQCESLG